MAKRNPFDDLGSYSERAVKRSETKPAKKDRRMRAMTYRIGDDLITRINRVADEYRVNKQPLVRALLTRALDELESGAWELPVEEDVRGKLNI